MITAIVMASGYSKRMGQDKLLIDFGGKKVIERVLDALKNSKINHVIVVAREKSILEVARNYGFEVIENLNANEGISASIRLGIEKADEVDGYMFVAADQPFLSSDLLDMLIEHFEQCPKCIVIPSFKGRRGNPVIFPSDLRDEFLALKGDTGGKAIISTNIARLESVEIKDESWLEDIDTKEALKRLKKVKNICHLPQKGV